jgi:hypothetical protein
MKYHPLPLILSSAWAMTLDRLLEDTGSTPDEVAAVKAPSPLWAMIDESAWIGLSPAPHFLYRVLEVFARPAIAGLGDGRRRAEAIRGLQVFDPQICYREV